jgi:hypothetical protein
MGAQHVGGGKLRHPARHPISSPPFWVPAIGGFSERSISGAVHSFLHREKLPQILTGIIVVSNISYNILK